MPRALGHSSLALTAAFAVGLEVLTVVRASYWFLFSVFLLVLVSGTVLALVRDVRARGPHVLILPLAYIGSVLLFHLYISQGFFQQLFILLTSLGFFALVARGVEWAYPTWNWFFTSATFFLFTAGAYGFTFHLRFPVWGVALLVGVLTFLLSLHVLGRAPITGSRRLFWSVLLTLVMTELLGALSFLPLTYIVVSGVLFVAFYVSLHLLQRHLYDRLTPVIVREYLLLGSAAVGIVLGTARWSVA